MKAALSYPQVTYTITLAAMVGGLLALAEMPRREEAEVTVRRGLVLAAYPGATASQVEDQVTRKVEQLLFGYPEVKKERTVSTSAVGGMVVDVWLADDVADTDRFWSRLRHDLNELAVTDLPQGLLGPIVNSNFGDVLALLVAVTGEGYGYQELQPYLERIETEVLQLPTVATVRRFGERQEKIFVTSSSQRLVQYGITPLQVIAALQQQNQIMSAGAVDARRTQSPIRATGLYQTEDQIRRQIVGLSPTGGGPITIGDFAEVRREYGDPDSYVRSNGAPSLMLGLEMRAGENIVDFGEEVEAILARLQDEFPPAVELSLVVDQPSVVRRTVGHFLGEFAMALFVVVAATLLLLPLRVAAIAAVAIPVTISLTLAALWALGIDLHQVTLAGLIIVLGLVVDDAIVITDNYVELLGEGHTPEEASWRAPRGLVVPVFASTLIIWAAFLPLLTVPGTSGEYIASLPITVALALLISSGVAMLLTPLLCRAFIKEPVESSATDGEKAEDPGEEGAPGPRRKRSLLDVLQGGYDWLIHHAMRRRRFTLAAAVFAVLAGLGLGATVDQSFFPPAQRDQFSVNVRLPEGSRIESTFDVVRQIEEAVAQEPDVLGYASFVGMGAPRFYSTFEPSFPGANMAQVVIHTSSMDITPEVVRILNEKLPPLAPEAELEINQLTQGNPMWSPIEVRISGPEVRQLQSLGRQVEDIFLDTPGTGLVRDDFREPVNALVVDLRAEMSNRLGMTRELVSNALAWTFLGLPVSTFWEGDRQVDIVIRVNEERRSSFDDVGSTYLTSEMARVPLRAVAEVRPEWQESRIIRRNGVRTLTVGAFSQDGVLNSDVLARAMPDLEAIPLPAGYEMTYGGEHFDQIEAFGHMSVAMAISVIGIFLILLFQFRNLRDPMVVLVSIPLGLFGAFFGLVITGNSFGFTAFMGLISLTGMVVRNAIILLDFIHGKMKEGIPLESASMEAGKRRLRPIFLTTVSAAAGLTPMILGGSGLWAPMASLIVFGILFSMVFTLVVVPVLYVVVGPSSLNPEAP